MAWKELFPPEPPREPDPEVRIRADGRSLLVHLNRAARRLLGWPDKARVSALYNGAGRLRLMETKAGPFVHSVTADRWSAVKLIAASPGEPREGAACPNRTCGGGACPLNMRIGAHIARRAYPAGRSVP